MCLDFFTNNTRWLDHCYCWQWYLAKTQTFLPVVGVVPALIEVALALITVISALFIYVITENADDREWPKDLAYSSLFFAAYSLTNICLLGLLAPVLEYKMHTLSKDGLGKKNSTAGFIDLVQRVSKNQRIIFLRPIFNSTSPNFRYF